MYLPSMTDNISVKAKAWSREMEEDCKHVHISEEAAFFPVVQSLFSCRQATGVPDIVYKEILSYTSGGVRHKVETV